MYFFLCVTFLLGFTKRPCFFVVFFCSVRMVSLHSLSCWRTISAKLKSVTIVYTNCSLIYERCKADYRRCVTQFKKHFGVKLILNRCLCILNWEHVEVRCTSSTGGYVQQRTCHKRMLLLFCPF